jgi:glycine oxidase
MERSGFDRAVDNAIAISLRQKLAAIMPILHRLDPVDVWTGFRPLSDSLHIGRWHETCLYLAYGHFRNGILLAPVTAERITSEVMASRQACASAS